MAKHVICTEAGYDDCEFEIRDGTVSELVELVRRHAVNTHGTSVSESDVRGLMRDVRTVGFRDASPFPTCRWE